MLHLLKKNTGKKTKFFPGKPSFNPTKLVDYRAGYLMNYTTDIPTGSINPLVASAQWFDGIVMAAGSKLMQRGNATVTINVNGFKAMDMNIATARLQNTTIDVFNGVTDFTIMIGFKRPAATLAFHLLGGVKSSGGVPARNFWINTNAAGTIGAALTNAGSTNVVSCTSAGVVYNNDAWHVILVTVDQTNKTLTAYTEIETMTGSNAAYVPGVMTPDSQGDFSIGAFDNFVANPWTPGEIGDVIILSSIASPALINNLIIWEKNRLGI